VEQPLFILDAGLVTSVGLSTAATCAAIRAGVTNPTATRFMSPDGDLITAHQVPLETPWRGPRKLLHLLVRAAEQCLGGIDSASRQSIPVLLCLAERTRPGRQEDLDDALLREFVRATSIGRLSGSSAVIAEGRGSMSLALEKARRILSTNAVDHVLIVAADSLLTGPTLAAFSEDGRLLSRTNSNGFIPGEAGGAVLVGRRPDGGELLTCDGLGLSAEHATIYSDEPLRAQGLTTAVQIALREAAVEMHEVDLRVTDASGEQYYFKETTLALSRTMHRRRETFDIWHPADCIGEVGAAAGPVIIGVVLSGCRKGYLPGPTILVQNGSDSGVRGAFVLRSRFRDVS
jgi:3-oxoacyl-[acyl-carrier-protein] synthase I